MLEHFMAVTLKDIQQAAQRIKPYIHQTPLLTCQTLNNITQAQLYFKCENFQKVGAFKFRGACNAVFSLTDEEAKNGVATHSSGNHAAALALAAKMRGIPAYIVMPSNSAEVKKKAVAGYGANITYCEPNLAAREATLAKIVAETHAKFIHPYDNENIIAGQGTAALELLEQAPEKLDIIIAPVGGGGLLSGIAIAVTESNSSIHVIGAEPKLSDDAFQSFQKRQLIAPTNSTTICDGLLTSLGKVTFPILLDKVSNIFTASEENILFATKLIWERMKIIIEPSSAVTLAIILENPDFFREKKIGLILSGGNVDLKMIGNLLDNTGI
jgi:threonine dehydratase